MLAGLDTELEAKERAYYSIQARLFLLRFALLFAVAALFWFSGLSVSLAHGLREWFPNPYAWPLVCASMAALATVGYEVILFPLSVFADFVLEHSHGQLTDEFGTWFRSYLRTMLIEAGIMASSFTAMMVFLRLFPVWGWLWCTAGYALIVFGLGEWGPSVILPYACPPTPIEDPELERELKRVGEAAGVEISGAAFWNFEHHYGLDDIRLAGWGLRRKAVFTELAWRQCKTQELVFMAARHAAWHKNGAVLRTTFLQVALVGAIFFLASWAVNTAARWVGLHAAAPETLPLWVMTLFSMAALVGMVTNAVARSGELRADRFALKHAGGREVLESILRQKFEQEPFAWSAPWWQVVLLNKTPTPARRIAQALALEKADQSQ